MHFDKILVTTDLSESSCRAFELAAYQAKMEGTEVTLLTVVSDWTVPPTLYPDIAAPERIEEYRQYLASEAKKTLESYKKNFHGQKVKTEVILSSRAIADEICDFAKKNRYDLIVMSSQGRSSLSHFILGSVVQKVMQLAPCPVMVIPPKVKR